MKTATTAPQTLTQPLPGQPWPGQGGIYAGIVHNTENGQCWHLIVAPEDALKALQIAWGPFGEKAPGVGEFSRTDGQANTKRLLTTKKGLYPAAELTEKVTADGHTDYYLPAQREALLMAANLGETLGTELHWTSTQYSAHDAWCQDFEHGGHDIDGKGNELAVRAVRRILII